MTRNNLKKNDVEIVEIETLKQFLENLRYAINQSRNRADFAWSIICVLIRKATGEANYDADPAVYEIGNSENVVFRITDRRLHFPVVTLSIENEKKLLEQLKSGLKRTVKWNKYRSQMIFQPQNNNLNYLIDPTITNVNRLFVLSFARNAREDHRDFFTLLCTKR